MIPHESAPTSVWSLMTRKLGKLFKEGKQMIVLEERISAPTDNSAHWSYIQWDECCKIVRKLQARIVKATQEERWNKVKALQHLLTHSLSGKAIAVRRVIENKGKKTPGVDGEIWSNPEVKTLAIQALKRHGYKPKPLRRVTIAKRNGGRRHLGIPTVKSNCTEVQSIFGMDHYHTSFSSTTRSAL